MVVSRFLGPVEFAPVSGGAQFTSEMDLGTGPVPVTVYVHHQELDHERHIHLIDSALEVFAQIDEMSREAISAEITQQGSQPWTVIEHYRSEISVQWKGTESAFVEALRLRAVEFHPDGGADDIDRIITTYSFQPGPLDPVIVVRIKERRGPFVDPAA